MGGDQELFDRILFEGAIERLPPTVKERILLDADMQERWGFGVVTGVTLGHNGPSFERGALFDALRAALEKLSVPVDVADDQGVQWEILVSKGDHGHLEFWISNDQISHRLLAYADFTDYLPIIIQKKNWAEVFAPIFGRQTSVQEFLQRLYPIRVCTMHARMITQDDELFLFVETHRVMIAIGVA